MQTTIFDFLETTTLKKGDKVVVTDCKMQLVHTILDEKPTIVNGRVLPDWHQLQYTGENGSYTCWVHCSRLKLSEGRG